MPTLVTGLVVWIDWGLDYIGWFTAIAVLLVLAYQIIDSIFLKVVAQGRTPIAVDLWDQMSQDKEFWSLKGNIWATMALAVASVFYPAMIALTLFLSLAMIWAWWRYVAYTSRYDDQITDVKDFMGSDYDSGDEDD